ncbi:hypothetical protein ACNSOB_06700 [Citrobacter braakii]|uniref:hypothetical protein n=1 Tax=Citrobacter braakii TaxID=57706 RepID=UPI003AB724D3
MTTNHPAHGPVSLDRLHQISEIPSKAAAQSDGGNIGYAMADAVKVIDSAIAARSVEAIYQVMYGECWRDITEEQYHDHAIHESPIRIVYTAPPAPVVPDEKWVNPDIGYADENGFAEGWNACRAAMIQSGNHTEQRLDMVDHSGDASENVDCRLSFDQWLSQQNEPIDVDCGCVTTEAFYHWLRAAYDAGNSPVIGVDLASGPDRTVEVRYVAPPGYVMVPKKLTAENGAKSVLSGEFSETKFINCPECFGDDDCETCDGSGRIEITVPVTWTTIKAIWAKGVEHFAAAPQQEVK